jgi:hypothetical protein
MTLDMTPDGWDTDAVGAHFLFPQATSWIRA